MFLNYKKWHKENFGFCLITGSTTIEQYHVMAVGMGNNRKKNIPEHLTLISLVKPLHDELHAIGLNKFEEKYNINIYKQVIKQIMNYFHDQIINKTLDEEFRNMEYYEVHTK